MTDTDTALSTSARDLLKRLAFREAMGTSYLVYAARGREALVVPEMTRGSSLARACAYNRSTIVEALNARLITWSDTDVSIQFSGRKRLDSNSGQVVALTDAGRAAAAPR